MTVISSGIVLKLRFELFVSLLVRGFGEFCLVV